ncbi:hypothetical protein [Brachyspira hyodysenteriae]|uniref:hypothetical protein n=1 Tax=Brachyspira hyodysenteriae TaxID=159 RepID=UPI00063DADF6|nr:hypothetical protein [Brachyspira hyodysenteriae]KLI51034.1 hypothetical protein SZ43_10990 [Brachyspira hyodysenteriae]MCZ9939801.1 hypothetical protein [Brachyspira hyodysenteriae]MDA0055433.1 hypothetical protein [Brachyspira hyodysenteriae]TVL68898.1 hypothetical protein A9X76_05140 [Brachyspira hyodysenteriae]
MKSNIFKLLFILLTLSLISLSCSMLDVTGSDNGIEKEYRGNRYSGNLTDDEGQSSKAEIVINSDGSFDLNLNGTVTIEAKNIINQCNGKYSASQGTSGFELQFSNTSLGVIIVYYDNGKKLSGTLTKE